MITGLLTQKEPPPPLFFIIAPWRIPTTGTLVHTTDGTTTQPPQQAAHNIISGHSSKCGTRIGVNNVDWFNYADNVAIIVAQVFLPAVVVVAVIILAVVLLLCKIKRRTKTSRIQFDLEANAHNLTVRAQTQPPAQAEVSVLIMIPILYTLTCLYFIRIVLMSFAHQSKLQSWIKNNHNIDWRPKAKAER